MTLVTPPTVDAPGRCASPPLGSCDQRGTHSIGPARFCAEHAARVQVALDQLSFSAAARREMFDMLERISHVAERQS